MIIRHNQLITDTAAVAATLRRWLEPDTRRAACLIWEGLYPPSLALDELQGQARLIAARAGALPCNADSVARRALVAEYLFQRNRHQASLDMVGHAVTEALRAGADRKACQTTADRIAAEQALQPPAWMVQQAIDDAAAEFRAAEAWWRERAVAA